MGQLTGQNLNIILERHRIVSLILAIKGGNSLCYSDTYWACFVHCIPSNNPQTAKHDEKIAV